MTRDDEKAIENLKSLKEDYWGDDGYGHETEQYEDVMYALDTAIEAIEQRSVLDKALTEIIDLADANDGNSDCQQWFSSGLWKAVQIINNCKAESKKS